LLECIKMLKPSVLIGVAAVPKAFTKEVVEAMAALHDAPVIFSLSNPTSKAECLATEAYAWSGGRAVFASGSPMEGATVGGRRLEPGQGNNAYIFPGVGLAAVAAGCPQRPSSAKVCPDHFASRCPISIWLRLTATARQAPPPSMMRHSS
jgi:malate dehydrogenase (oxaloacetate-decarboxylating)(NADP+)